MPQRSSRRAKAPWVGKIAQRFERISNKTQRTRLTRQGSLRH